MSQSMLSRLADISTPKHVSTVYVHGESYKLYRLSFEGDVSNIFVFRPTVKGGIEKIIDLDTGNALFPNNRGCCYMVYTADYRILGPFLYRLFISDDKKKLTYQSYASITRYSDEHAMYDFTVGESVMCYGQGPTNTDLLYFKLKNQPKRLVLSNQGAWRLEEAAVG